MDKKAKKTWLLILWIACAVLGTVFVFRQPITKPEVSAVSDTPTQTSAPSLGDVNKDGILDASDVLALQNIYLTGATDLTAEEQLSLADINGDGIIDTNDTSILTSYLSDSSIDTSSVSLREYAGRYSAQ